METIFVDLIKFSSVKYVYSSVVFQFIISQGMGWDSLKYCGARLVETSDFLLQFATVYPHCAFLLKDLKDVLDKDLQYIY